MKQKDNTKNYNKEFFVERVKEYIELRNLNYQIDEIEDIFLENYGIKDISTFRKCADILKNTGQVNVTIDSELGLMKLARARNMLLVDRKITTKQRNELNNVANVEAFRTMILDTLKDYKWETYTSTVKGPKKCLKTSNKGCVYVLADIHYKGRKDNCHLNNIFDKIEQDIYINKIENCEIWFLGDDIEGLLHIGSLSSSDGSILPCIEYCNVVIERMNKIKQLSKVNFVCQSNHLQTRALGTGRNELAKEDLGYVIANTLKFGLRKDIELVSNDIIFTKYKGLDFSLIHGSQPYCKSKAKAIEYWSSKYGMLPDVIMMAHFHNYKVSEYGLNKWLVVCPTAKSFNGNYEHENGFISNNQFIKIIVEEKTPQFSIINIGD